MTNITIEQSIKSNIAELPGCELRYYLTLLLACIKNENALNKCQPLLEQTNKFTQSINAFYQAKTDEEKVTALSEVTTQLSNLVAASKPHRSYELSNILLKITGVICALVFSLLFAVIGIIAGPIAALEESQYYVSGGIKAALLGFISGLLLGCISGFRAPEKLAKSKLTRKLDFCINNLARVSGELEDRQSFKGYEEKTKDYILNTFFPEIDNKNKEQLFNDFLSSEQTFEVCTTTAGHFTRTLKGYLGHHALIKFKINGIQDKPIEFGDRTRTPSHVDQNHDTRQVSGKKLFEMLVLERILEETHQVSKEVFFKLYDIGSDDCQTYIDKILIGTQQAPRKIGRFDTKNDRTFAGKVIEPIYGFFNRTDENELTRSQEHTHQAAPSA